MKKDFHNIVCLDKLIARLIKKNVARLFILSALAVALFATPTTTFANSTVIIGDGPLSASSATPSSNNPSDSLTSIHMLDKTHGWALTTNSVLKTADGGLHWQKVIPANAFGPTTILWSVLQGAFLNDQDAWVVAAVDPAPNGKSAPMNTIMVLRTTNGGQSWQNSIIHNPAGSQVDRPEFINASEGWLQSYGVTPTGNLPAIFHTTNGGQHWNQLGNPNLKDMPNPSGVYFSNTQNGWEVGHGKLGAQPLLEVTHDGGKTWQNQSLPVLPGAGKSDLLSTKPPVFSGNNGLLPVEDQITPPLGSKSSPSIGLDLYATHNGGQTWTPTKLVTSNLTSNGLRISTTYAMDSQHVWGTLGTNLYATSNGGQSWTQLPQPPQPIDGFSFIDLNNGWAISSGNVTASNTKNQSPNLLHTIDGGHTWQPINYSIVPPQKV
ncbi:MAG TPA: hypothetical protein VGL94_01805 [Ktedonobacteraceae bacterium]